jgi:dienelactone hydrolase
VAVLRADYARGLDSGEDRETQDAAVWERDIAVRSEINDWFAQQLGASELLAAGICRGARVVLQLAAHNEAISGLLLIAPPLLESSLREHPSVHAESKDDQRPESAVDPRARDDLLRVAERIPLTMLCSDREAAVIQPWLGARARDLQLISGPRLNRMESPEVQSAVLHQTVQWACG